VRSIQEALDLGEGHDASAELSTGLVELAIDLGAVHAHAKRGAVHAQRMFSRVLSAQRSSERSNV
jgi:hypothetical protein